MLRRRETELKIVSFAPYVPHPRIHHAGGNILGHYLLLTSKAADVTLIAPATAENRVVASYAPEGTVHLVDVGSELRLGLREELVTPLDLALGFGMSRPLIDRFRQDQRTWELVAAADVIEIHFGQYAPLVRMARSHNATAVMSVFEPDVFSQYLKEQTRLRSSLVKQVQARLRAYRASERESRLLRSFDLVFTYCEKDRETLSGMGVADRVKVVDPFFELPAEPSGPAAAPVAVFAGAMSRPENINAAAWLITEVWPRVVLRVPEAKLLVVGARPPRSLVRLARDGVEVTGFVPDLAASYGAARVSVAPNRSRAGIKLKILQAMANALPVVGTPEAVAGVVERSGPEVFGAIVDGPAEFADAVSGYLSDREAAIEVGARARSWVSTAYDFEGSVRGILKSYSDLARPRQSD